MEQLIYMPYKAKLKLSHQELEALVQMMGRMKMYEASLSDRALFEWTLNKRLDLGRKLLNRKPRYSFSLNATDALHMLTLLTQVISSNSYEQMIYRRIEKSILEKL